jgi:hypothetical protein
LVQSFRAWIEQLPRSLLRTPSWIESGGSDRKDSVKALWNLKLIRVNG